MKIEKYVGRDSKEVMARVRADLGADAYILGNRRVRGGVELTVAADIDAVVRGEVPAPAATPTSTVSGRASGVGPTSEIQFKALERELDRLRGILESELGERGWRDVAQIILAPFTYPPSILH